MSNKVNEFMFNLRKDQEIPLSIKQFDENLLKTEESLFSVVTFLKNVMGNKEVDYINRENEKVTYFYIDNSKLIKELGLEKFFNVLDSGEVKISPRILTELNLDLVIKKLKERISNTEEQIKTLQDNSSEQQNEIDDIKNQVKENKEETTTNISNIKKQLQELETFNLEKYINVEKDDEGNVTKVSLDKNTILDELLLSDITYKDDEGNVVLTENFKNKISLMNGNGVEKASHKVDALDMFIKDNISLKDNTYVASNKFTFSVIEFNKDFKLPDEFADIKELYGKFIVNKSGFITELGAPLDLEMEIYFKISKDDDGNAIFTYLNGDIKQSFTADKIYNDFEFIASEDSYECHIVSDFDNDDATFTFNTKDYSIKCKVFGFSK